MAEDGSFEMAQTFDFSFETVKAVTLKLLAYCKQNAFSGHDPYDALNSKLLAYFSVLNRRFPRLALTQFLKRSPLNFRHLLLIPKTENPKAIALFLMAFLRLRELRLLDADPLIHLLIEKLINLRSLHESNGSNNSYWCWGYSFPWQTRTIFVPRGAPNLVCTTFVANALLEAYETLGEIRCLDMAASAARYIVDELYWTDGESTASLSYPTPSSRARTHNANFMGAALLHRVYNHCGGEKLLHSSMRVARYSASQQHEDGSWHYGDHSTQRWIDNFHTGYNLCALNDIGRYAETSEFESYVRRGFAFYRHNFFREDGAPKYYHNRVFPIDIHCVAQSIITLTVFRNLDETGFNLAHTVFRWAMANMWDDEGYFFYQALPLIKIRTSYMRWSQAWMLLALSALLQESSKNS